MCSTSANNTCLNDCTPRGEKRRTISPIREVVQKDGVLVVRASLGVSLHALSLAIHRPPHKGLEPVHNDLNRLLCLVLEQFEQRPRVALHATTSDEDSNGLERVGELIPLAAAVGGRRPLRAEDDTPGLREGRVERVERVAPKKEGGRVQGEALQEILHVDGRIRGRAIRDEVERLGGRLVEDVKVGDAFLCEERAGDLAALREKEKKRLCVRFGRRAGRRGRLCGTTHDPPPISFAGEG